MTTEQETIFVPKNKTGLQQKEFDPQEIFSKLDAPYIQNVQNFEVNGQSIPVNLGSIRFHVFAKNPRCACCGVIGNRMFLDENDDDFPKTDAGFDYHFNLYAESGSPSGKRHLVLMVKSHIVPLEEGGTDDWRNMQTMCFSCASFRTATGLPLDVIRSNLFCAYRIYKSSLIVNEQKEKNHKLYYMLKKARRTVEQINENLSKASPESAIAMQIKAREVYGTIPVLEKEIFDLELKAQVSGRVI